MTNLVAIVSVRTGIPATALAEYDPLMWEATLGVLREQDRQAEEAARGRR